MTRQIHIINKYFFPVQAGIETCIYETYTRFSRKKWDITIHTSQSTLHESNVLPCKEKFGNLFVRRYKTVFGMFSPDIPWTTDCIVVIYNFSLLPIMPILTLATIYKLIGLKKAIIVFAPHGGFTPQWEVFPFLQKLIKLPIHRFIGRHMINYAVDWIHSVAQWEKQKLVEEGINEKLISVIPNGVEDAGFISSPKPDKDTRQLVKQTGKYLVLIGRVHPIKNIHIAIKSLLLLPKSIKLLILGQVEDDAYLQFLKTLLEKHSLTKRVIFAGTLRGMNKFYVIKQSIAMVHPSQYEVDPLVVKEAIAQNTICIGAENTGTQYLIKHNINGFLVPTGKPDRLAEKVSVILKNPQAKQLQKMKVAMRKERDMYHWDEIAKLIEKKFALQLMK